MAMTGTTSPLELAWTIGGVVGLVFTVWLLLGSWWDYRSLRQLIDAVPPTARELGPRWWTVAKAAGLWLGCLYLWLVFVAVGLLAIHYPPPPPNTEQQVSSQVFGWLLLSGEFVLVAAQAW